MSTALPLDLVVAGVYREASLRGADMRAVADAVESLRPALRAPQTLREPWNAVNAAIAARHPDTLQTGVLALLRDEVLRLQLDEHRGRVDRVAEESPKDAEREWMVLLGDATAELWSDVISELGAWAEDRPFLDRNIGALAVEAGPCLDAQRYPDARPFLDRLAHDERLAPRVRFDVLILLGQIALFRMDDVPRLRGLIAEATALDADSPAILEIQSDLAVKRSEWAATDDERLAQLAEAERLLDDAEASARRRGEREGTVLARRGDLKTKKAAQASPAEDATQAEAERDGAEVCYRDAVALEPWDASHLDLLAAHLVRGGCPPDHSEVTRLVDLARLIEPTDAADTDVSMASALLDAGHLDEARQAYQRALDAEPGNIDAITGYSALLQVTGDLADAATWLAEVDERCPGTFDVAQAQAWVAEAQERYDDAAVYYRLALERRPEAEAGLRANLAWVQQQRGDEDAAAAEAIAACQVLVDREDRDGPAVVPATSRLLDVIDALAADDMDGALTQLDTVRSLRGDTFEADYRNRRGVVFHNAGRYPEAVEEYRKAVDLAPNVSLYWDNFGLGLREVGDFDGAQEAAERVFSLDGDASAHEQALASIANRRGNAAFNDADYGRAVMCYREAVARSPDDAVILGNLAEALLQNADQDTVVADFGEAVELLEKSIANGGQGYEEKLRWARRGQQVARALGGFVLMAKPSERVRVRLPSERVPVFVDEDRLLKGSIMARLNGFPVEVGYGIRRPGIRFLEGDTSSPSTVRVLLNGQACADVEVKDDPEPVLRVVEQIVADLAEAFIGPDEVTNLVRGSGRADLVEQLDDPERLLALTSALRASAGPEASLDAVLPPPAVAR